MLVDVVELNVQGKRLPRDVWKHAQPIRGELAMLNYFSWHGHENAPVFATLQPYVLESLDKAKVLHMAKRSIVIIGDQRYRGARFEQVWWCRFVVPAAVLGNHPVRELVHES